MSTIPEHSPWSLHEIESVGLLLRGNSVIDWQRLNFDSEAAAMRFISAQEFRLDDSEDLARMEAIKQNSINYLRRHFEFPIPKPVADSSLPELLLMASGKGHRQLCACIILKVMHIIHHLEARELLFMLPVSDQEVFQLVEKKVYGVIGNLLARGVPILEFVGGRKNKDSLYTKLLSKQETIAAQIYDKLRFRIVTRNVDDVLPTLIGLMEQLFPFNYVIPGQSANTLLDLRAIASKSKPLRELLGQTQFPIEHGGMVPKADNRFTSHQYRVVHFVVDMPIRLPNDIAGRVPRSALEQGKVIFVQTEFQVIDRVSEQFNEQGEASHEAYKERQRDSVMRRLKLGNLPPKSRPTQRIRRVTKING